MARRTRDQVLAALQTDLKAAQRDGKTAIIADCSLLLSHATARPAKETPAYVLAVKAARNRQSQRAYRKAHESVSTRHFIGDVVRHRYAPTEGPFTLDEWLPSIGLWIAQPGNLRMSPDDILATCGACAAKDERIAALVDAFWSLIESDLGTEALDRAEATLRSEP